MAKRKLYPIHMAITAKAGISGEPCEDRGVSVSKKFAELRSFAIFPDGIQAQLGTEK